MGATAATFGTSPTAADAAAAAPTESSSAPSGDPLTSTSLVGAARLREERTAAADRAGLRGGITLELKAQPAVCNAARIYGELNGQNRSFL